MKITTNGLNQDRHIGMRRFSGACALSLVLALGCAGCAIRSNMTAEVNPAGVYRLVTVNGKEVPCAVLHQGHAVNIKSGTFTIGADGTCKSELVFSPPSGRERSRVVNATYTQDGSKLRMKWQEAGWTMGTVERDTFTMINEGMTLYYHR